MRLLLSPNTNATLNGSESVFDTAQTVVVGVLTLSTILGNILVLMTTARIRATRTVSHVYVGCLAACELLIGVLVLPPLLLMMLMRASGVVVHENVAYDVWQFADACLSTIALHTLLAIGIDRWLNIERPLRIYTRSRGIAKRTIVLTWLVPIGAWMIALTILCRRSFIDEADYTSVFHNSSTLLVTVATVLYLPYILLVTLLLRIAVVVRKRLQFLSVSSAHSIVDKSIRTTRKLTLAGIGAEGNDRGCSLTATPTRKRTLPTQHIQATSPSPFKTDSEFSISPLPTENADQVEVLKSPLPRDMQTHFLRRVGSAAVVCEQQMIRRHGCQMPVRTSEGIINLSPSTLQRQSSTAASRARSRPEMLSNDTGDAVVTCKLRRQRLIGERTFKNSIASLTSTLADSLIGDLVSAEWRATRPIAIITLLFLLCWTPFLVLWPWRLICLERLAHCEAPSEWIYQLSVSINYCSCALNPWLYTLLTPRAKKTLRSYWLQTERSVENGNYNSLVRSPAARMHQQKALNSDTVPPSRRQNFLPAASIQV